MCSQPAALQTAPSPPHELNSKNYTPALPHLEGKGWPFVFSSVTWEGNNLVWGLHSLSQLPSRWAQIPREGAAERC